MANELLFRNDNSSDSLYSVIIDLVGGHILSAGSIDSTPTAAEWGNYSITMTEVSDSQLYRGTIPGSVPAGYYSFLVFVGGSPAIGDPVKSEPELFYWDGANVITNNIDGISGDSTAANNIESDYDGTGFNKSNSTIGTVTTNTDKITAAEIRSAVGLTIANLDTQLADIPTVAEFQARTLLAAAYFDPATDIVANVTLVDTTTTNTDMRGTNNAALATGVNVIQIEGTDATDYYDSIITAITVDIDANSTQLVAILADTNELQTDWANGGRLDTILDTAAAGAGGSGLITHTYTVIDDALDPMDGVEVIVTTDILGQTRVASGTTGILGTVVFMLDAGTYYFWKQIAGYSDDENPDTEVVA